MKHEAESQDLIPWKDFMEGKLSKEIFHLQHLSLACPPLAPPLLTGDKEAYLACASIITCSIDLPKHLPP